MIKIIDKILNKYMEYQGNKMQRQYSKFMKKQKRKDEKLDKFYCKVQSWIEGAD